MTSAELETANPKVETDLREIAQDIVRRAMAGGATAAECVVREGDEFSTLVRLGQVETLKESGSKSIGVRVFFGQRAASTYSSDFSRAGLDRMVKSALDAGEDYFGRSVWRNSGGLAAGFALRRSRSCTTKTFIRCRARIASTTRGARKRPRSISIRASRIPKADRLTPPRGTRFWRIRMASWASIAGLIVRWRRCRSRRLRTGAMQRDYWYSVARTLRKARCAGESGQDCGGTHAAPAGRAQGEDRAGADYFRSHGCDFDSGAYFRRG